MSIKLIIIFILTSITSSFKVYHSFKEPTKLFSVDRLEIEKVSVNAANKAGAVLLNSFGKILLDKEVKSKIGSRDIVTEVDKNAQEAIRSTIMSAFPDHHFLGEEDIEPGIDASAAATKRMMNSENLWIVDPLDGTTNFAHGMPLNGIIIAYASKGIVKHGLIYDPYRNEMFTAWKGNGAYLNGNKINCCSTAFLRDAVVCTGSPPNLESLQGCLRATNEISSKVRTVRMLGSASIMLSWLACGRITAYFETDMNVWDIAAGSLLVQEAGGSVSDVWGSDYQLSTRNFVSSNGHIHKELLSILQKAEMWMPSDKHKLSNSEL